MHACECVRRNVCVYIAQAARHKCVRTLKSLTGLKMCRVSHVSPHANACTHTEEPRGASGSAAAGGLGGEQAPGELQLRLLESEEEATQLRSAVEALQCEVERLHYQLEGAAERCVVVLVCEIDGPGVRTCARTCMCVSGYLVCDACTRVCVCVRVRETTHVRAGEGRVALGTGGN